MISLEDVYGAVGASSIHDDVFVVWIVLAQQRQNTFLDEPPLIERGCDNADFRKCHQSARSMPRVTILDPNLNTDVAYLASRLPQQGTVVQKRGTGCQLLLSRKAPRDASRD